MRTVDWWHPEQLAASEWYVPTMNAGDLVSAAGDADTIRCRPVALLLVRNLSLTGTWSTSARELMGGVHDVGPFLMQVGASSAASTDQQTSIGGAGLQVIGVIGAPIPALPPSDDPKDPGPVGAGAGG